MKNLLGPGTKAPDFELHVTPDQTLSLKEFAGRRVILAFYPADWSPVCGDQMALYNQILPEFRKRGAEPLGISVDGAWCHRAFADARKLHFPCSPTSSPRARSQNPMAPIAPRPASPSARSSSSTKRA